MVAVERLGFRFYALRDPSPGTHLAQFLEYRIGQNNSYDCKVCQFTVCHCLDYLPELETHV